MEQKNYTFEKHNYEKLANHTFSSGQYYTIILVSKGGCQFELDGRLVYCNTESAVFLKPEQSTAMHFHNNRYPLELIILYILPTHLAKLSDESCDLEKAFSFLPLEKTMIHLDIRATTLIKNLAKTIMRLETDGESFGKNLYERNMLSVFLILFLRSCIAADHVAASHRKQHLVMDDIFRYIRDHLTENLSLDVLEQKFFVSRHHLCREFKRLTGQTIHAYIVKSRLDLCKKYIESGKSIKEVYKLGGFSGYHHFFRAFKKEYGITPKEYYKSLTD